MPRIKYKEIVGLKVKKGKSAIGKKPNKEDLQKLYLRESKSIREIADLLACTKDMVYRCLKEYGIQTRTNAARSKLRRYGPDNLENGIEKKGLRGLAKELGVHENTIRHYLKGVKPKR